MIKPMQYNPVREAVELLGGPTKVAGLMKVSNVTVHNWINKCYVARYDKAEKLSRLSKMDMHVLRGISRG